MRRSRYFLSQVLIMVIKHSDNITNVFFMAKWWFIGRWEWFVCNKMRLLQIDHENVQNQLSETKRNCHQWIGEMNDLCVWGKWKAGNLSTCHLPKIWKISKRRETLIQTHTMESPFRWILFFDDSALIKLRPMFSLFSVYFEIICSVLLLVESSFGGFCH